MSVTATGVAELPDREQTEMISGQRLHGLGTTSPICKKSPSTKHLVIEIIPHRERRAGKTAFRDDWFAVSRQRDGDPAIPLQRDHDVFHRRNNVVCVYE